MSISKHASCANEWGKMHEVTISSDYSTLYFPSTNDDEEKLINLKDIRKKGDLAIITHQNDHHNRIISKEFQLDYFPTWPRIESFNR